MPRYEHEDTSSFWEIEKSPDGKSFTARWGKLGTDGRKKTKKYDDAYACSAEYDELVSEKLKLGYAIKKPNKLAFALKSNPQLEATLCEAIDDPARWAVYADWLQEAGDFRGEMIALGLAGKTDEAKAIADAKGDVLWGDAWSLKQGEAFEGLTWTPAWNDGKSKPVEVKFEHTLDPLGFIDSITMWGLDEEGHVAKAMHDVLASPIGRFTRSIRLIVTCDGGYSGASGSPKYGDVVAAIAGAKPAALRRLELRCGEWQQSWTATGDLGPLLAATPNLESIELEMGDIDLGASLDLPKLQVMRIETGGLDRKNLIAIGAAKWPSLVELTLYFGTDDYGGNATAADVDALLAHPEHFPKLEQLALCNSEVPGPIVAAIVKSPLLAQIKSLDLSKGTMIDDDARPILENQHRFEHLERFDLTENYLSPALAEMLKAETEDQYYDEMVRERERHGHEEWAKESTFRYTRLGE